MSEILKEYDESVKKRSSFIKSFKNFSIYVATVILVVIIGVYFGNMLFGKRSLDVYLGLQSKKERLLNDVSILKEYNAQLQKEYFELKELDPQGGSR